MLSKDERLTAGHTGWGAPGALPRPSLAAQRLTSPELRPLRIDIVTPAPPGSRLGNRHTALRYARLLRELGHAVRVTGEWRTGRIDLLVALHAKKSAQSVAAFREQHADRPCVLVLTGTDLYGDIRTDPVAQRSLDLASRLVVLQPRGLDELSPEWNKKAVVLLQSAEKSSLRAEPLSTVFEACVIGHLRAVKDPLRAALAARLLPESSRISVVHAGAALEPGMESAVRTEAARNPRYRWLGDRTHAQALRVLARSRLFIQTSLMEGGSCAMAEALVHSVPILATRIPGAVGMLGEDHPGLFAVGDTQALSSLMSRCDSEPGFLVRLRAAGDRVAPLFERSREKAAWAELIADLARGAP